MTIVRCAPLRFFVIIFLSLIGSLASFLYQYLLWTFDWAYNSLFLVYIALFSLSLWTLVLVLARVDYARVRAAIGERFPVRTAAGFSFIVGGFLLLKCLSEILPGFGSDAMPVVATGYDTLVDQALDLGLSIGRINVAGIAIFSSLICIAIAFLVNVLAGVKKTNLNGP